MENTKNYRARRRDDYRKPAFLAPNTELTFELSDENTVVRSNVRYKRNTDDPKVPLILNGEGLRLNTVSLDGSFCKYTEKDSQLIIEDVPDEFELQIENVISPVTNSELMGLYKSNGVFCTQCEPEGFRRITYFLDRPDVLSRYRVTIIGPEYGCGVLLSNGNLIESGSKKGRNYAVWEDPFPKPSYLFALVAGTFDIIEDTWKTKSKREVQLKLYVDRGACDRGLWAMEALKQAMKWDEDRWGLEYDLDNFKIVAVDFFNQGAMENKSLNIFNSICVLADPHSATDSTFFKVQSVIGHEYFHNYTGDRVTLRDWFQLSLKESLTVFRDQEFSSDVASRTLTRLDAINVIRGPQFAEDASPTAHPVRPEEVMEMNNFYTVTIYDKGAEVIRMLHTIIGEELFAAGLHKYLHDFDGQSATIDDFLNCMQEASGTDLSQFRLWYSQAGTPEIRASWNYDESLAELQLKLVQRIPDTRGQQHKKPMLIPVRMSFIAPDGRTFKPEELPAEKPLLLRQAEQTYNFKVSKGSLPVLLEDFSAPVRLEAPYTEEDYRRMLQYSNDAFIRTDSSNRLQLLYVKRCLKAKDAEPATPGMLTEAFATLLTSVDLKSDLNILSEALRIQSLRQLMENFSVIDLDALIKARCALEQQIAVALSDKFNKLYELTRSAGPKYSVSNMGMRALNSVCLHMLAVGLKASGRAREASTLVNAHYQKAKNMTETLAALTEAVHNSLDCAPELLNAFSKTWSNDTLVFDNFFKVQASAPIDETVFTVRKLLSHPNYDSGNPNRIRALPGTMAGANPVALHRKDGAGYKLICSIVEELNDRNTQMAAKLLTPLLSFRRFDTERAEKMQACLTKLRSHPRLARSLYEKLQAALEP